MRGHKAPAVSIDRQFQNLAIRVRNDRRTRFVAWLNGVDLGPLECKRSAVRSHALAKCRDCPESEICTCAQSTVEGYLADPEAAWRELK